MKFFMTVVGCILILQIKQLNKEIDRKINGWVQRWTEVT